MNPVKLNNISVSFDGKPVLKNFSCEFEEGKITVIEGPSGVGKTTLLSVICGLISPDSGSVDGIPERIAFVFQENRLAEDFTAISNIRLVTGRKKSEAEITDHLVMLGLPEKDKRPVREYSGGMKRRVAIARAILSDSELILMDEPFQGLDEKTKGPVMDYVIRFTRGKTLILVTHDPKEAAYLGGRVFRLGNPDPGKNSGTEEKK